MLSGESYGGDTLSSDYERQFKKFLESKGFMVIRSAGSLAVDLVALNPNPNGGMVAYLLEVKSFVGKTFYISKSRALRDQWTEMRELQRKFVDDSPGPKVGVYYALHRKRYGWKLVRPSELDRPFHWTEDAGLDPSVGVRI